MATIIILCLCKTLLINLTVTKTLIRMGIFLNFFLYRCPELIVYSLSFEGTVTPHPCGNLKLDKPPWSCSFDWSDRLWVCLPHDVEPLICYKFKDNQVLIFVCVVSVKYLMNHNIIIRTENHTRVV